MKKGVLIATLMAISVLIFLVFVPTPFFSKHYETTFNRTHFYCGGRDVAVSTFPGSEGLTVFSNETEDGGYSFKEVSVQLQYTGSAMFSDYYKAKTGQSAEFDGELKLSATNIGADGTCY